MLYPDAIPPKTRRHLSFDPLIRRIRLRAKQLPDPRNQSDCEYSMADALMSALALFSLKDPSLLAFEKRRYDENIKNLFRVLNVPSDTQMRTILDPLESDLLRPMFNDVFRPAIPAGSKNSLNPEENASEHSLCFVKFTGD